MSNLSKEQALRAAWTRGLLKYKLYDYQVPVYTHIKEAISNPECLKYVLNIARRFGKTTILCLIAMEYAIQNPDSQIRFAAPTNKNLKKIITPIFKMLLKDCPEDLKPIYNIMDSVWRFPNGSELHTSGANSGHIENLRGTASNLNIIDEAGFVDELDYAVNDVLVPQTLTTGGKTILASTPPKTPAHDLKEIAMECEAQGFYQTYTIHDNTSLDAKTIAKFMKEAGGANSTTWKREYLAQWVVDDKSVIIPEWKDEYIKPVTKDEFYPFYYKYSAMDLGVKDFTALLFGYYDFNKATLVIEDEAILNGPTLNTEILKSMVEDKEKAWLPHKVHKRISDNNNLHLLQDLGSLHRQYWIPTNKESLEAMINQVRLWVNEGRIIVSPKCEQLIGCLKYGVWDTKGKSFARSKTYGHFDALAALVYLVRNVDTVTNPIPKTYKLSIHTHYLPDTEANMNMSNNANVLSKAFGIKKD